jgi:hypothetical protein
MGKMMNKVMQHFGLRGIIKHKAAGSHHRPTLNYEPPLLMLSPL